MPKQSAADLGDKSRRNSGAVSRLYEPKEVSICKGRREGLLSSEFLGEVTKIAVEYGRRTGWLSFWYADNADAMEPNNIRYYTMR